MSIVTCNLEPTDSMTLRTSLQRFHCQNEHVEHSWIVTLQSLDLASVLAAAAIRTYDGVKRRCGALCHGRPREMHFPRRDMAGIPQRNTLRVV